MAASPDPYLLQANLNLADRLSIQDVISKYFRGIDSGDKALVRNCFTSDVTAIYDGREPAIGLNDLMSSLKTFQRIAQGNMQITMHFMGNFNILSLEKDIAETETYAIAHMVPPKSISNKMAIRGLRYLDFLRREAGVWKIAKRRHTLDWSYEASPTFAGALSTRLNTLA